MERRAKMCKKQFFKESLDEDQFLTLNTYL